MKATEATVAFDATGGGNIAVESNSAGEDEVSAKAFSEELNDLADATQVLGSETWIRCSSWALSQVCTRRWAPKVSKW